MATPRDERSSSVENDSKGIAVVGVVVAGGAPLEDDLLDRGASRAGRRAAVAERMSVPAARAASRRSGSARHARPRAPEASADAACSVGDRRERRSRAARAGASGRSSAGHVGRGRGAALARRPERDERDGRLALAIDAEQRVHRRVGVAEHQTRGATGRGRDRQGVARASSRRPRRCGDRRGPCSARRCARRCSSAPARPARAAMAGSLAGRLDQRARKSPARNWRRLWSCAA